MLNEEMMDPNMEEGGCVACLHVCVCVCVCMYPCVRVSKYVCMYAVRVMYVYM